MAERAERTVANNVRAFLDRASSIYAKVQERNFRGEMTADILENVVNSPIEDLFWIAVHATCAVHDIEINQTPERIDGDEWTRPTGFYIRPQEQIGKYRVDFILERVLRMRPSNLQPQPIVVELDGHDFHDKDKDQRAREKARDRYLTKHGYRVLHYTGSEINADPFKVAHEALTLLAVIHGEYDPADPVGLKE